MGSIVLSQSVTLLLYQVEEALEVWFGKRFVIVDSKLNCGPISIVPSRDTLTPLQQKRKVSIEARFRERGQSEEVSVSCSLSVKRFHTTKRNDTTPRIYYEWWFIEQKPTPLTINGYTYTAVWEEPYCSTVDIINITVSDEETEESWTGLSYNERWPSKPHQRV